MLLNPYRFASAGGGSGHRYWQVVGVAVAGDYLQISELQLLAGGTVVSAGITPTSSHTPISHTLADLVDGQLAVDQVTWTQVVAQDPSFYIRFDLGTTQPIDGVRQAGGDTSNRYMSAFTLQYADSPTGPWTDYGSEVGLAYPGHYTLSEVYDMVPT